ncbi:MAG: HAMP domain-containing protein, partial [Actinomycetia bacterium]|nr:HAMP domain-containing protein [Actinomycetes bacterium]
MARLARGRAPVRGVDPAAAVSSRAQSRGRGVRSIRERIVVTILLLTSFGLGLSGVVAYVLQSTRIRNSAFEELERDRGQFIALAAANSNPANSGKPFVNASELLSAGMQSKPLSDAGGAMALSDGKVIWTAPASATVRPESNELFKQTAISASLKQQSTNERFTQGGVDWAYSVVPVVFAETGEQGALVRVIDLTIERRGLNDTFTTYTVVAIGAIVSIAGITWLVMSRLLLPISWVQRTAEEISEHDISRRIPVRGNDDLAALTHTVNTMLDRLESAVGAQKRLLDDVGHELRT